MSETERHNTAIEWTHLPGFSGETWNPVVGCTKVSPGCKLCYAETLHNRRHKAFVGGAKLPQQYAEPFNHVHLLEDRLERPLRWKKPRAVFVNSLSDLFHEEVPQRFIDTVFAVMALTPRHRFMVLTKRPERMRDYLTDLSMRERVDRVAESLIDIHGTRQEKWDLNRRRHAISPTLRTWPLPNVWLEEHPRRLCNAEHPLFLQAGRREGSQTEPARAGRETLGRVPSALNLYSTKAVPHRINWF